MEITIFLARFWGGFFIIFGLLSLFVRQLGRTIERAEDESYIVSTGGTTFVLGLMTVVLHNYWVWDWTLAITILGWSTLLKGIMKVGFPEHIRKRAQGFKQNQWLSGASLLVLGAWLFMMSFQ